MEGLCQQIVQRTLNLNRAKALKLYNQNKASLIPKLQTLSCIHVNLASPLKENNLMIKQTKSIDILKFSTKFKIKKTTTD